jgi:hypothetical protein
VHRTITGDLEIVEREVDLDAAATTEGTSVFG